MYLLLCKNKIPYTWQDTAVDPTSGTVPSIVRKQDGVELFGSQEGTALPHSHSPTTGVPALPDAVHIVLTVISHCSALLAQTHLASVPDPELGGLQIGFKSLHP